MISRHSNNVLDAICYFDLVNFVRKRQKADYYYYYYYNGDGYDDNYKGAYCCHLFQARLYVFRERAQMLFACVSYVRSLRSIVVVVVVAAVVVVDVLLLLLLFFFSACC